MPWWSTDDPRRFAGFVAAVLAATAALGLGLGAVVGMRDDGGATTTADGPGPASGAPAATRSPSSSPSPRRAASEIEPGIRSDIGYFLATKSRDDGVHATFDRVIFKTGRAAKDYAKTYHTHRPKGPDHVLLINNNPLTRDLVLSPDVVVLGGRRLTGSSTLQPVSLRTLTDAVAQDGPTLLLDLGYDDLGYVTRIAEHDLP